MKGCGGRGEYKRGRERGIERLGTFLSTARFFILLPIKGHGVFIILSETCILGIMSITCYLEAYICAMCSIIEYL